ncbi:MAG: O-antigen ligase family protein [Polyangia bacterium]
MASTVVLAVAGSRSGRRIKISAVALFPAVFVVLTALQLLPLPPGLGDRLDPRGAALLAQGGGGTAGWRPLTLDSPATVQVLARSVAAFLTFVLAYHWAAKRTGRSLFLRAVAITGVAAVVIGLGHRILAITTIYGLFTNGRHAALLTGPFVNANHTAEFLELATFTAIACARQSATTITRASWFGAAAISAAGALATLSRSSVFALGIGVAVLILGRTVERVPELSTPLPPRRGWLAVVVGLIAVGVIAVSIGAGQLLDRFRANAVGSDMRLGVWRDSLTVLRAHPFGIGRQAFDVVYPIYRTMEIGRPVRFSFVENEPLQMLIDFGYWGFALVVCAAVLPLRHLAKHGRRDGLELGLLAGVTAIAAHSVTDFGLETLGVLLPFMAVLGTLLGRNHPVSPLPDLATLPESTDHQRTTRVVLAGLGGAVIVGCLSLWATVRSSGRDFDAELKGVVGAHDRREVIWAARQAHPLDYYYPLVLSTVEPLVSPNGGPSPRLRALNQALRLCANCPEVHLQVARTMWRLGRRPQALSEWATATRNQPAIFRQSLDELTRLGAQPLELTRLADDNPQRILEVAQFILVRPHPERAAPVIDSASAMGAPKLEVALLRARMDLSTNADAELTGKALADARSLAPDDSRVALLDAEYMVRQGGKDAASVALATVERALDRKPSDLDLQRKRIELVSRFERWTAAERAILGYKQALQEVGRSTVEANLAAAGIYVALGRVRDAMAEFRIATMASPDDAGLWRQFASTAEAARYFTVARDAYAEVMRLAPDKQASEALRRMDDEQAAARLGIRRDTAGHIVPRADAPGP